MRGNDCPLASADGSFITLVYKDNYAGKKEKKKAVTSVWDDDFGYDLNVVELIQDRVLYFTLFQHPTAHLALVHDDGKNLEKFELHLIALKLTL